MRAAIMFSGQGAQYPGMMGDICEQYKETKKIFDEASSLLGKDIYGLSMRSAQEELDLTENTQPCLLTCELAAFHIFRELGLRYDAVLGFSLGEWAALAASNAISHTDAIRIIEKRAAAMQRAVPSGAGGMAVMLGKDEDFVSAFCQSIGNVSPANYNCPGNISVSGTTAAVDSFLDKANAEGIMASRIAISIPSHCALMAPAAEELRPLIQAAVLREPEVEFVMNATGLPAAGSGEIKENLIKQLTNPVRFQQSTEYLLEHGFDTFIEIGPGKTLSGMVKRTAKQAGKRVRIVQFNSLESVEAVKSLQAAVL